jgi:tetratricopeptide (TPR) repeat protein
MSALLLAFLLTQAQPAKPTAPSAEDIMKKLESTPELRNKEKSFEVAASIGRLYLEQGRYTEAVVYYAQAMAKAEPIRAKYLALKKKVGTQSLPPAAKVDCLATPESSMDSLAQKASALEKKNSLGSISCLQSALQPLMDAEVRYGDARFLTNDYAGAMDSYSKALETFESNANARYSRAALIVDSRGDDLKMLAIAKTDFELFIKENPQHARAAQAARLLEVTNKAMAAGGTSKLRPEPAAVAVRKPGMPPVLTPEMMNAFNSAPRTPEMNENFAKLVEGAEEFLVQNKFDEALTNYKQVMPYQPDNARLRAGMAWTMVKLNRQPMADNVWRAASQNPEAIDALALVLKTKGNIEAAQGVVTRLKETVPSYSVTTSVP